MSDYISLEAALEAFENADADVREDYRYRACAWGFGIKNIQKVLNSVTTADVELVRHGRWVRPHWRNSSYCCDCSECGGEAMHREYQWNRKGIYPICPNCGVKMDLEDKTMKIDTKDVLPVCADGQQNRSVHESKIERPVVGQEDPVKQPSHYKHGKYEVIDEMLLAFGPQRTYDFCIMNAWKYRSRALYKGNCEQDMAKADQYMSMAKEIIDSNQTVYPGIKLIRER